MRTNKVTTGWGGRKTRQVQKEKMKKKDALGKDKRGTKERDEMEE
jgi:hypothetical protein